MERIHYLINEEGIMTSVLNHKYRGGSLAIAMADMISIVMRISNKDPFALVSPQPLIDANVKTFKHFHRFCVVYGLESEETYPLTPFKRDWDESVYLIRTHERYRIDNLCLFQKPDEIKEQIVSSFRKKGKKYPIVGVMCMGGFRDPDRARTCMITSKPFCPDKNNENEDDDHALLIVGCNTLSKDPSKHYCYVKNGEGKRWGKDGFSMVVFDALKYIMVAKYENEDEGNLQQQPTEDQEGDIKPEEAVPAHCTAVYVALPLKTGYTEGRMHDPSDLRQTLEKLKDANVDGVMVRVLWGVVERSPKEYDWCRYKEVFEAVEQNKLKIQVVICFHEVMEGDLCVSLPSWVLDIGKEDPDIFFTDKQKKCKHECLSWGIDNEDVLKGRTALEVYSDFMENFRSTFSKFLEDKVMTVIEIGLGPHGELRYPSFCSQRGWKYPGVGAFQCYDKYLLSSMKKAAIKHQYDVEVLDVGSTYNSEPDSCGCFCNKDIFDGIEARYFLNSYAQQLIKHGDRVLSEARSAFGKEIVLNVKLSGAHWWYNHKGGSHAAELTAGFFTSCQHDGYYPVLKVLKAHNVGLNFTVDRSHGSHPTQSSTNPDDLMDEVRRVAMDVAMDLDFYDEEPVPLSTWNPVPCQDNTSYRSVLHKVLEDKKKIRYSSFTYHGLHPLMNAPQEFAEFVTKMHGDVVSGNPLFPT